jgi:tRNA threonylcarbamoyladenosine biosynthesis protein TsaE
MATAPALARRLTCPNAAATRALGVRLGRVARAGDVVCLWGELGAGKTVLAKGFGAGLGVTTTVSSPSFILMSEHAGRIPLFHLDLYRLAGAAEAHASGLLDERQAAGVTIIEWPDRLGPTLPRERVDVEIEGAADAPRTIVIRAGSPDLARYLDAAVDGAPGDGS